MSRWKALRGPNGSVLPSGLDVHTRGARAPLAPGNGPKRAVVVHTYVPADEENLRKFGIECDVVLLRSHVPLARVPVAQTNHGVNNVWHPWIPRPSTRTVSANQGMSLGGSGEQASPFGDLDGDQVLVEFMDGDLDTPVITRALSHEQTKRIIVGEVGETSEGRGWVEGGDSVRGAPARDEYYVSQNGTELRVGGKGDVLIDTTGAHNDLVEEAANNDGGHFRVRMKDSMRFTVEMDGTDVLEVWKDGSQVRIDLGEGAAQRLILGDAFRSWFNDWLTHVFANHQHGFGTLTGAVAGAVATITGLSGAVSGITVPPLVPPPPLSYTGSSMSEDLLSDLAKTKKS